MVQNGACSLNMWHIFFSFSVLPTFVNRKYKLTLSVLAQVTLQQMVYLQDLRYIFLAGLPLLGGIKLFCSGLNLALLLTAVGELQTSGTNLISVNTYSLKHRL